MAYMHYEQNPNFIVPCLVKMLGRCFKPGHLRGLQADVPVECYMIYHICYIIHAANMEPLETKWNLFDESVQGEKGKRRFEQTDSFFVNLQRLQPAQIPIWTRGQKKSI